MPIYEYRCENPDCGMVFERIERMADSDQAQCCPRCQTMGDRVISFCHAYLTVGCGGFHSPGMSGIDYTGSTHLEEQEPTVSVPFRKSPISHVKRAEMRQAVHGKIHAAKDAMNKKARETLGRAGA